MNTNEIQKFNSEITKNFIIENGNTYITAQGIITLKNILNTETYKDFVTMKLEGVSTIDNEEFLKRYGTERDNNNKIKRYQVKAEYSDQGMINKITIDGL